MKKRHSLRQMRGILDGPHYEPRFGTRAQAREYCLLGEKRVPGPDNGPWTLGEWTAKQGQQGKRTDLDDVVDRVRRGKGMMSLAKHHPTSVIRYGSGLQRLIDLQPPPQKPIPVVRWFWGSSGTGKSHTALTEFGIEPEKVCRSNASYSRTFQQYRPNQHTRFIFENFQHNAIPHAEFLQYLDKYPTQVQILYGVQWFVPKEIYITCTFPPTHYWSGNELREVERRLKEIREFTVVYDPDCPPTRPHTPSLECNEVIDDVFIDEIDRQ